MKKHAEEDRLRRHPYWVKNIHQNNRPHHVSQISSRSGKTHITIQSITKHTQKKTHFTPRTMHI